jgi:methionyl-tRNA formyltransferase
MKEKNSIVFAGCKDTTKECIGTLLDAGYSIDLLITIPEKLGEINKVAGYMDLRGFAAEHNIPVYMADSYHLKSEKDKEALGKIHIDILLVIGWQRLIPEWLLGKLGIGAFGMHGSSHALPYGRGRTPMNWSLIQNRVSFISNLFKYSPGVDDGDILDTQLFDVNPFDNGRTMHYKSTLAMAALLKKNLKNMLQNKFELKKQMDVVPTYYPKRTEEDGIIFWDRDAMEIYNLIRAVTSPFHGAFTFLGDNKIKIWEGFPFDSRLFDPYIFSGTILHIFNNGDIIIKTGDSSFIITKYEMDKNLQLKTGDILHHGNYQYKNPHEFPC